MNRIHHWICSSNRRKRTLANEAFPRILDDVDLGKNVLRAPVRQRMPSTNVAVVEGDATDMEFGNGEFSAAVSLWMLRDLPLPMLQDRLLSEVFRSCGRTAFWWEWMPWIPWASA